jgi:hypothetical protein
VDRDGLTRGLGGFSGLIGGVALVAVTTRIAQQARAPPTWAVWVSYAVAVLCLSGLCGADFAAVPFWLWLIGAVVGELRTAGRTPSAQGAAAELFDVTQNRPATRIRRVYTHSV